MAVKNQGGQIAMAINGKGKDAENAMANLNLGIQKKGNLYFYEK